MTSEELSEEDVKLIKSLYRQVGYEGNVLSPCSAVLGMLYQLDPENPEYDDGYRRLVETFLKSNNCKNVSIDRDQFYKRIKDVCRGIMYAYQHMRAQEGDDCLKNLSSYSLHIQAQFDSRSKPSDNFFAAIIIPQSNQLGLLIATRLIGLHALHNCQMNERVFQDDKIAGNFNAREMAILTGIEEGVHAIQMNRELTGRAEPKSTTYHANDAMNGDPSAIRAYENDPMEREVKEVLEHPARELKLGSNYARVQRSSKGELPPK